VPQQQAPQASWTELQEPPSWPSLNPLAPSSMPMAATAAAAMMMSSGLPQSTTAMASSYASSWFSGLRGYFNVSHAYVFSRLQQVLFPWFKRKSGSSTYDDYTATGLRTSAEGMDLYIPLMAFLTYILAYAVAQGSLANEFHPDLLFSTSMFAFVILLFEVGLIRVASYILGLKSLESFWDQIALSSYKFVHLSIVVLSAFIGIKFVYWATLIYSAAASGYLCYNNSLQKNTLTLITAFMQLPIIYLLQPRT
jgi:protein transport protein YIF1